jgi:hypothetical protein
MLLSDLIEALRHREDSRQNVNNTAVDDEQLRHLMEETTRHMKVGKVPRNQNKIK